MKNNWNNNEANNFIKLYKQQNISKDLALRVYTTQLLGKNNKLVLHGGGNTSLKTTAKTTPLLGDKNTIIHGSGTQNRRLLHLLLSGISNTGNGESLTLD